mgnify:CR=1 FL=1
MDDLKKLAAPKFEALMTVNEEQNELLLTCIVLLDRLCTLKEAQQEEDNKWRMRWKKQKSFGSYVSFAALFFTIAAFYLNVIRLDADFVNAIKAIF